MFGEYQLLFRMNSGIWLGKKTDDSEGAEVCVKMISIPEKGERDTSWAENLLVSAALQQEIARLSPRWAPVLRLGSDGVDSFFITRKYPRSLQTLLDDAISIRPDQLRNVMLDILEGLVDLQHTYGVSHGNIKPANVFITSDERIDAGEIRLTDPDCTADEKPLEERPSDMQALGRLLYSMVTLRHADAAPRPLAFGGSWRRLGLSARQWFDLCDYLLSFGHRANLTDLADIRERLASIRVPKGGKSFVAALFF